MTDLHWLSATDTAHAPATRDLSQVELMTALLDRIGRLDPKLNAFIRIDAEAAMNAAKAAEVEIGGAASARAATRGTGRDQGHHRSRRLADNLPFESTDRQHRGRRRSVRVASAWSRRVSVGQAPDP